MTPRLVPTHKHAHMETPVPPVRWPLCMRRARPTRACTARRYDESTGRKRALEEELADLEGKLERAEKLVTGLAGERTRWWVLMLLMLVMVIVMVMVTVM